MGQPCVREPLRYLEFVRDQNVHRIGESIANSTTQRTCHRKGRREPLGQRKRKRKHPVVSRRLFATRHPHAGRARPRRASSHPSGTPAISDEQLALPVIVPGRSPNVIGSTSSVETVRGIMLVVYRDASFFCEWHTCLKRSRARDRGSTSVQQHGSSFHPRQSRASKMEETEANAAPVCGTLASIFLRLCSRNDFASPSATLCARFLAQPPPFPSSSLLPSS